MQFQKSLISWEIKLTTHPLSAYHKASAYASNSLSALEFFLLCYSEICCEKKTNSSVDCKTLGSLSLQKLVCLFQQMEGSSLETFLIVGRVSSEAVIESKLLRSRSYLTRVHVWFEELLLGARFFGLQIALWLLKFQRALTLWRRLIICSAVDGSLIYIGGRFTFFALQPIPREIDNVICLIFLAVEMLQRYIRCCCFWYASRYTSEF